MNVVITGATKGIGKAIARNMAINGHNLALCARNLADLEAVKSEILNLYPNCTIAIKETNCSIKDEVLAFADFAVEQFGRIDVLVNNVGLFTPSFILEEQIDSLELHMRTNLFAAYYLYKKLAPMMKDHQHGYIFNICSVASMQSIVSAGTYCVTKAALLSLNDIMREEMMAHQVKVTAILPGATLTDSWSGTDLPSDRFIQPEDIATAIEDALKMSKGANIDRIVLKPTRGQF
jgi:short-subunit dehydrogenase